MSERMPFDFRAASDECAARFVQEKCEYACSRYAVRFVSTDPVEAARSTYIDVSDDEVRRHLADGAS